MIRFIDEKGIIEPENVVAKARAVVKESGATAAITGFSKHIFGEMIESYGGKFLTKVTGGIDNDLYIVNVKGKPLLAYQSPIGAPAAAMALEEVLACGINSVLAFGICGALVEVPQHTFVVPDTAYSDEGTSKHYGAGDTVTLAGSTLLRRRLSELGLNAISGGAWCTDALYRETPTRFAEMKKLGCVAVDMECAALQAVCDYRKKRFYTFFITADSLAGDKWNPNYLLEIDKALAPDALGVATAMRIASELN